MVIPERRSEKERRKKEEQRKKKEKIKTPTAQEQTGIYL
jgi:hypothetical protein